MNLHFKVKGVNAYRAGGGWDLLGGLLSLQIFDRRRQGERQCQGAEEESFELHGEIKGRFQIINSQNCQRDVQLPKPNGVGCM